MQHLKIVAVCLAAVNVVVMTPCTRGADQPHWGQRYGRNMVSDETGLPAHPDPQNGTNLKWSVRLGTRSYSTPVIANGRILLGTNNDQPRDPKHLGDRGVLICLDQRYQGYSTELATSSRYGQGSRSTIFLKTYIPTNLIVATTGAAKKIPITPKRLAMKRAATRTAAG